MSGEPKTMPEREVCPACGALPCDQVNNADRLIRALHDIGQPLAGAIQDLETMKQFHPPSRRGSNYSHALASLEQRLRHAEEKYEEARSEINAW